MREHACCSMRRAWMPSQDRSLSVRTVRTSRLGQDREDNGCSLDALKLPCPTAVETIRLGLGVLQEEADRTDMSQEFAARKRAQEIVTALR